MKDKFYQLLDYVMQAIIVSIIVILGCLSVIGSIYSLMISFVYLQGNLPYKWKSVLTLQTFIRSLGLTMLTALMVYVVIINVNLSLTMSGLVPFIIMVLCAIFTFVYFGWLCQMIWESLWEVGTFKLLFQRAMTYTIISLPQMMLWMMGVILLGLLTIVLPQLIVLTTGTMVIILERILLSVRNKYNQNLKLEE